MAYIWYRCWSLFFFPHNLREPTLQGYLYDFSLDAVLMPSSDTLLASNLSGASGTSKFRWLIQGYQKEVDGSVVGSDGNSFLLSFLGVCGVANKNPYSYGQACLLLRVIGHQVQVGAQVQVAGRSRTTVMAMRPRETSAARPAGSV